MPTWNFWNRTEQVTVYLEQIIRVLTSFCPSSYPCGSTIRTRCDAIHSGVYSMWGTSKMNPGTFIGKRSSCSPSASESPWRHDGELVLLLGECNCFSWKEIRPISPNFTIHRMSWLQVLPPFKHKHIPHGR